MTIRLDKAWVPLTDENLKSVKGQLGVYQLGSDDAGVTYIGCADARTLFGLKGELEAHLNRGVQTSFRVEVTSAYQTRYRELLMVFYADHQTYPRDNDEKELPRLGRLSPA
jgi:hypothetical protein